MKKALSIIIVMVLIVANIPFCVATSEILTEETITDVFYENIFNEGTDNLNLEEISADDKIPIVYDTNKIGNNIQKVLHQLGQNNKKRKK